MVRESLRTTSKPWRDRVADCHRDTSPRDPESWPREGGDRRGRMRRFKHLPSGGLDLFLGKTWQEGALWETRRMGLHEGESTGLWSWSQG